MFYSTELRTVLRVFKNTRANDILKSVRSDRM